VPDDHRHGTTTGYAYGCRCTRCTDAKRSTAKRLRQRVFGPDYTRHGTPTGYQAGCRCSQCKRAVSDYWTKRRRHDPILRLRQNLRARIRMALQRQATAKADVTLDLVGCDLSYLVRHLEQQFQPGMSWTNYGQWHVDHIKPCAVFDLTKRAQQKACFHYTNLQPLWAAENVRKGAAV
jgi:hypothetical protein